MRDYASPSPIDRYGNVLQGVGTNVPAIAVATNGVVVSSMLSLDPRATVVEITATGTDGAIIKWIGSVIGANPHPSVTTANFDGAVSQNTTRIFVIPSSLVGQSVGSVIGGYGAMAGCYPKIATAALQTASILIVQK